MSDQNSEFLTYRSLDSYACKKSRCKVPNSASPRTTRPYSEQLGELGLTMHKTRPQDEQNENCRRAPAAERQVLQGPPDYLHALAVDVSPLGLIVNKTRPHDEQYSALWYTGLGFIVNRTGISLWTFALDFQSVAQSQSGLLSLEE